MTEKERYNKELAFKKDKEERKNKNMTCRNCKFYKSLKNETEGRCLSKVNGVKNNTTIWKNTTAPRVVYATEIHQCYM